MLYAVCCLLYAVCSICCSDFLRNFLYRSWQKSQNNVCITLYTVCVCVCLCVAFHPHWGHSSILTHLPNFGRPTLHTPHSTSTASQPEEDCELGSLTPWAILNVGNTTQLRYAGLGCCHASSAPSALEANWANSMQGGLHTNLHMAGRMSQGAFRANWRQSVWSSRCTSILAFCLSICLYVFLCAWVSVCVLITFSLHLCKVALNWITSFCQHLGKVFFSCCCSFFLVIAAVGAIGPHMAQGWAWAWAE